MENRLAARVGMMVALAFAVVMTTPNLPTALLPGYRAAYGMSPLALGLLFSGYLLVLVPCLLLAARPSLAGKARVLLPLAVLLAAVSDLVMATAAGTVALAIGRGLSGVAVGIATGAAAVLVVAAIGDRGRGSVAAGNIAGGLIGTTTGMLIAQWLAPESVYWVHLAACGLVGVPLVLWLRRAGRALAHGADRRYAAVPAAPLPERDAVVRRHALFGTMAGALCWAVPGLVMGLLPTLLIRITGPGGVLASTGPVVLFLACAWFFQLLVARTPVGTLVRGQEVTVGTSVCAAGLVILAVAAAWGSVPAAYLGCVLAAAGPALGYRGGMVLVTQGLPVARQGVATSRYAAIGYAASALVTIGTGALGALGSITVGMVLGAGLLALVAAGIVTVIVVSETRRLRTERAERARSAAIFA